MSTSSNITEKPYPRHCSECGNTSVHPAIIEADVNMKHDGKCYQFHVSQLPVDRCNTCSELFYTNKTSDAKCTALRSHLGLLQPETIRTFIGRLGLTQRRFAGGVR